MDWMAFLLLLLSLPTIVAGGRWLRERSTERRDAAPER